MVIDLVTETFGNVVKMVMMTNERAIELLHRISDSQFDGKYGDERREALEMAVRALEQNLVKESGDLVQDLVKDCISRQMAIDAVVSAMIDGADAELVEGVMELLPSAQQQRILYANMSDAEFEKWLYEHGICNPNIHESIPCDVVPLLIDNAISELPSAQPHWIPCSERLPEEDEDVLVCSEEGDIDIACWMPEQWTDEPHIEWWSGEYRVDAVAWMPLPEPYGGESDE